MLLYDLTSPKAVFLSGLLLQFLSHHLQFSAAYICLSISLYLPVSFFPTSCSVLFLNTLSTEVRMLNLRMSP